MSVVLPNGKLIASQATIIVPEPKELPVGARTANAFNELTEGSLTSIGQYCDHDCTAVFEKNHACMHHNKRLALQGSRNHTNKLWCFDLNRKSTSTTNKANAKPCAAHNSSKVANHIIPRTNAVKLTRFLHGACGSLCQQTILHRIKNNHLAAWPHLNETNVKQHIRAPTATILCHLDHQRKNKLSTKIKPLSPLATRLDMQPEQMTQKCNKVYVIVHESSDRIHTDQTGKFPIKSIRGCNYMLIAYVHNTNTTLH